MKRFPVILAPALLGSLLMLGDCAATGPSTAPLPPDRDCQEVYTVAPGNYIIDIAGGSVVVLDPAVQDFPLFCSPEEARTGLKTAMDNGSLPAGDWRIYRLNGTLQEIGQQPEPGHYSLARMARLVDDLLLLAGSDAGTWRMRMEPVDADALVIGAHEQFAPLVKARGLRLALDLPEETLPPLWGDAGRLRQLLLVFISNACAYAPAGSDVTLRARAEKGWVLLSVEDHGPGVPDAEKAHVFERFYRADKSRTGKEHYGLGLSVAQELAALHGGDILLTDTPGGGATFTLRLPVRARKAQRTHTGPA